MSLEGHFRAGAGKQQAGKTIPVPEIEGGAALCVSVHVGVDVASDVLMEVTANAQYDFDRQASVPLRYVFLDVHVKDLVERRARDWGPASQSGRLRSPGLMEMRNSVRSPSGSSPTAATSTPYCFVPTAGLE